MHRSLVKFFLALGIVLLPWVAQAGVKRDARELVAKTDSRLSEVRREQRLDELLPVPTRALSERLERVRRDLDDRRLRDEGYRRAIEELQGIAAELEELQSRASALRRRRAEEALQQYSRTLAGVEEALRARVLSSGATLEGLVAHGRQEVLPALEKALADGDLSRIETEARNESGRLLQEARDPCEPLLTEALRARQNGNTEHARKLFEELSGRRCVDPSIPSYARDALAAPPETAAGRAAQGSPPEPAPVPEPDFETLLQAGRYEEAHARLLDGAESLRQERLQRLRQEIVERLTFLCGEGLASEARDLHRRTEHFVSRSAAGDQLASCLGSEPAAAEPAARRSIEVPLTLDIWQSAWGDFSDFSDILPYLNRNHIRGVNLNPGMPMKPSLHAEGYAQLKPLVDLLRRGGVARIQFLYAELRYPIEHFAEFLRQHPDLGIDTIVDDSEFRDIFRPQFERNRAAVHRYGLRYSAFITLETSGNSGVSDETRRWALRTVDVPIVMSYFGCSLEEQKRWLAPYLRYADEVGRAGVVQIALLLGGKSVGRETSCERQLDGAAFQKLLQELHEWALSFRSYGGIVLETDRRLPAYDVAAAPLATSR